MSVGTAQSNSPQKEWLTALTAPKHHQAPVKIIMLGPFGKIYCTTVCLQSTTRFQVQRYCYS